MKNCCKIKLSNVPFPEFSNSRVFPEIPAYVQHDTKSSLRFDLTFGRPFQRTAGFNILRGQDFIEWKGLSMPFHPKGWRQKSKQCGRSKKFIICSRVRNGFMLLRATANILVNEVFLRSSMPSTSVKTLTNSSKQDHLSSSRRYKFTHLFEEFSKSFSGKLGHYTKQTI